MSEHVKPTNVEIEQFWSGIPPLAGFINLKPGENIMPTLIRTASEGKISRGALLLKTTTVGDYSIFIGIVAVSRDQLLETNRWLKSIPTSLLADKVIAPVITGIGGKLLTIEDIIRPELSSEPAV